MKYSEAKILVAGFEDGTYPAKEWTHKAHFVMALWYTFHEPLFKAKKLIKEGIKKYNVLNGGKNTDDSGYHETITEFYIRLIVQFQLEHADEHDFEQLLIALDKQEFMEKDFPLRFYSKELLMSKDARKKWVAPDRAAVSALTYAPL